jgi:hypothetical protein
MGPWNSGKTYSYCNVAAWHRRTNSGAKFYIIDTDNAVERVGEEFGDDFYDNVDLAVTVDWPIMREALDKALAAGGRDDFLCVDMIDKLWDKVQDHFIEQVWGKDADTFMLEYRQASSANPLNEEGGWGINWQVINKLYYRFMDDMVQRWPGHILCCTPAESLRQPTKDGKGGETAEVVRLYGKYNMKPVGQKKLGHFFHTILLTSESNDGWKMTSLKDRGGREKFVNRPINDFTMDYLVGVAGWNL